MEMWSWPSSGNATQVWAINPSAWGFDTNLVGPNVFQPVLLAGQYQDTETVALLSDGSTPHRPGLALNGYRTYDPFTGSLLQPSISAPAYAYRGTVENDRKDSEVVLFATTTNNRYSAPTLDEFPGFPHTASIANLTLPNLNGTLELGEILIWHNAYVMFPGFFYANPVDIEVNDANINSVSPPSTGGFIGTLDTSTIPYVVFGAKTPATYPLYAPVRAKVSCEENCGREPPVKCRTYINGGIWELSGPPPVPHQDKQWKTCLRGNTNFDPKSLQDVPLGGHTIF